MTRLGGISFLVTLLACNPSQAQTDPGTPHHGETPASLDEVAREIKSPIRELWTLTFDHSIEWLDRGELDGLEPSYVGSFEPVMPVNLSQLGFSGAWARDYNLVSELTVPFVETVPLPPAPGRSDRRSGFGDVEWVSVLSPARHDGFLWALGTTFIFPTASGDALGQGKWQAGPAAVLGFQTKEWSAYAFAQQWWSFAGADDRAHTNQLSVDYALLRFLPNQWVVGMQPSLYVDWTESHTQRISFPIGLGVGKTFRIGHLPIQLWLEADYYLVRPDGVETPRFGIDFQITPVIRQPF